MATMPGDLWRPDEQATSSSEHLFYSISEAARLLGVSRVTIWRWIRAGQLPVARLGHRTTRIARADLERLPVRIGPDGYHSRVIHPPSEAPTAAPDVLDAPGAEHLVQFYDSDSYLLQAVTEFVLAGIRRGEAALVVATPPHREQLADTLRQHGCDIDGLVNAEQYVALDAAETLRQFMVGGRPDPALFNAIVGGRVRRLSAGDRHVRIYGEMVALLAADENHVATIGLEQLWNELQRTLPFSLLCGYPMDQFGDVSLSELLGSICTQHSRVMPTESFSKLIEPDERLRAVALLQQQAGALRAEVAERKRAEDQLRVALESERQARAMAEAALHARDEFLAIASHELKTPLTTLSGQVQLALRRLARDDQYDRERVAGVLEAICGQANKLARLLNHLLDISRLEAGKLSLDRQSTDFRPLLEQVVANAREQSDQHALVLEVPPSLPIVIDPLRIEQVVTNLLDNAIKYSPNGGEIQVRLSRTDAGWCELAVRDHGLGIVPHKREHIFERFYQAHGNAPGGPSGMGLGLHISREIVELHGGQIRAEFPEDGGSRFVVRLPLGT